MVERSLGIGSNDPAGSESGRLSGGGSFAEVTVAMESVGVFQVVRHREPDVGVRPVPAVGAIPVLR